MKNLYYSIFFGFLTYALSSSAINDFVTRYGTYGHVVTMPQYFILHDYSNNTSQQESITDQECSTNTQKNHTIQRDCTRAILHKEDTVNIVNPQLIKRQAQIK